MTAGARSAIIVPKRYLINEGLTFTIHSVKQRFEAIYALNHTKEE